MSTPKFHKPQTRQVENYHGQNPHDVNERQPVTISERSLGKVGDDGAKPYRLMKGQCGQDSQKVNQIEMQDIVKQGHPAKYR